MCWLPNLSDPPGLFMEGIRIGLQSCAEIAKKIHSESEARGLQKRGTTQSSSSPQVSIDKQKIDREVANYCQERLRSINTDFTLDKVSRQEATFALRDEAASYLKSVKNIDPTLTKDSFTSLARKSIAGLVNDSSFLLFLFFTEIGTHACRIVPPKLL